MANQDIYINSVFWGLFQRRYGFLGKFLGNCLPAGIRIIRSKNTINLFVDFYYVSLRINKYLLMKYCNELFSLDNLKSLCEKNKIVLSKSDIQQLQEFKPI